MEYVQKYWYLVLGALVLLFFMSRRSGGGIQQVGGSDATTLQIMAMNAAERAQDADRQFGLAGALLNFDLAGRQLDQNLDLARIQAEAQAAALYSQDQLARLSFAMQNNQFSQQAQMQMNAINQQASAQRRGDYLSIIGQGIQSILPMIFGNSVGGLFGGGGGSLPSGGYGTPSIFGNQSGGWQTWGNNSSNDVWAQFGLENFGVGGSGWGTPSSTPVGCVSAVTGLSVPCNGQ
jgi:hypothetical protein